MNIDGTLKDLSLMVSKDEKILWFSKPQKLCFILESIFNPLLPFALIWGAIDFTVIFFASANSDPETKIFLVPFMLLHLMPVWIYLGGVLMTSLRYKNTGYIITTKGIYVSSGTFSRTFTMKPFTDLSHVNIHRGIFDQYLGVGDVISSCAGDVVVSHKSSVNNSICICDIADYQKVFKMVKDLQEDVYADTMYPNALRPENNPGYNTQYSAKRDWQE